MSHKFKVGDTVICEEIILSTDSALWSETPHQLLTGRDIGHIGTVVYTDDAQVRISHIEVKIVFYMNGMYHPSGIEQRKEFVTVYLPDELEIWEDPDLRNQTAKSIEKFLSWMAKEDAD